MLANISLDLDNQWAYQRAANLNGWDEYPTYFPLVVPRIIKHLALADITATIFVVGRDLEREENCHSVKQLSNAGHEMANHSYEHEPWLHLFDRSRLEYEICYTGRRIKEVTGVRPIGFRGPGFSDDQLVHEVLRNDGYRYIGSSFPSSVGPLARTFYLLKTGLLRSGGDCRKNMFGKFTDMFKPNRPHRMRSNNGLWMFPVTVQPITRLPFHFTYLFFLSQRSPALARFYFRTSVALCHVFRVNPSLLLHPTDFLTANDVPSMKFFPGMNMDSTTKLQQLQWFLDYLAVRCELVSMNTHWQILSRESIVSPADSDVSSNFTR